MNNGLKKSSQDIGYNPSHKMVTFFGLSANLSLDLILDRINLMTGPYEEKNLRGMLIKSSIHGRNFKDVALDFSNEQIWKNILDEASYDDYANQSFFKTSSGDIYVSTPLDDLFERKRIISVAKLRKDEELLNVRLQHPPIYSVSKMIVLLEDFLSIRNHGTITTNEIYSIFHNQNCSYLAFFDRGIRNDFIAYIEMKLHHKINVIFSQAILIKASFYDASEYRHSQHKKEVKAKPVERYENKMMEREHSVQSTVIEYKRGRKEVGNAGFTDKSNPKHKLVQGEIAVTSERSKFTQERPTEKREYEKDMEQLDEPAKKLPRRFKFTIESRQMQKMFALMGTGKYSVNLEEAE